MHTPPCRPRKSHHHTRTRSGFHYLTHHVLTYPPDRTLCLARNSPHRTHGCISGALCCAFPVCGQTTPLAASCIRASRKLLSATGYTCACAYIGMRAVQHVHTRMDVHLRARMRLHKHVHVCVAACTTHARAHAQCDRRRVHPCIDVFTGLMLRQILGGIERCRTNACMCVM